MAHLTHLASEEAVASRCIFGRVACNAATLIRYKSLISNNLRVACCMRCIDQCNRNNNEKTIRYRVASVAPPSGVCAAEALQHPAVKEIAL